MTNHNHYEYEDENGVLLHIRRGPQGTALVGEQGLEVHVLAEHVPGVCQQLADKAGTSVAVLDTSWIEGNHQIIGGHQIGRSEGGEVMFIAAGPWPLEPKDYYFAPEQARLIAAALVHQADIAEETGRKAAVEELAQILMASVPAFGGTIGDEYALNICRGYAQAALAAGYRKAAS